MKKKTATSDLVFRKTFASKGNEDILAGLAKDFFSIEPKDITINNPYSIENYYKIIDGERKLLSTIHDVKASFKNGDLLCEMQVNSAENFKIRALYYAADAYASNYGLDGKMELGSAGLLDKYSSLRNIYAMNFLGYEEFKDEKPFRFYQLYDAESRKPHDPDNIFIAYFEFKKEKNLLARHKHWSDCFNERPLSPKAPAYIKKAVKCMDYINLSEEERGVVDAMERWQADFDSQFVQLEKRVKKESLEEGRIEGRVEGEKRNAIKTALRLLERGFSVEEIADLVELPVESIIKIQRGEIFDV